MRKFFGMISSLAEKIVERAGNGLLWVTGILEGAGWTKAQTIVYLFVLGLFAGGFAAMIGSFLWDMFVACGPGATMGKGLLPMGLFGPVSDWLNGLLPHYVLVCK